MFLWPHSVAQKITNFFSGKRGETSDIEDAANRANGSLPFNPSTVPMWGWIIGGVVIGWGLAKWK